jgi:hypothetical protein
VIEKGKSTRQQYATGSVKGDKLFAAKIRLMPMNKVQQGLR